MGYSYPIDSSWNYEELMAVMDLLVCVEKAYEGGIGISEVSKAYTVYHNLGFTRSDERQLDRDFLKASGYSLISLLKECAKGTKFIKLQGKRRDDNAE